MAYRIGDYVVYGELRNVRRYSTAGTLVLRGESETDESFLRVELTGDCDPDIKGKHIRFWPHEDYPDAQVFRAEGHKGLQLRQIGPTGTMTAEGYVRMLPCTMDEFLRRSRLGEPPPPTWVRRLYLEWFSQNGRVVVEMPGAYVEECVQEAPGEDDGRWQELPNLGMLPAAEDPNRASGVGVTVVSSGASSKPLVHRFLVSEDEDDTLPYESDEDDMAEIWLADTFVEDPGTPLSRMIGGVGDFPRPETLNDDAVKASLKGLLGRLAMFGIALDVCEHFSPRACYELLIKTIIPEESGHEEMIGTGWVQHFSTWGFCPDCEERALKDYEQFEKE